MQLFIALYRMLMNGPLVEFAAYWAECPDDARNAAVADFRVMHPELAVRTTGIIIFYPTADDKARYHGPDFTGRKAYWVIPLNGSECFGIAADNPLDAAECAFKYIGSNQYIMSPSGMTDEEAIERLGEGWDK